jgi:alanine-synthesizing transaminase
MPEQFGRIKRLPPYVFAIVNSVKIEARKRGEDIIDLGMGNPDQGTPRHRIRQAAKGIKQALNT